MTDLTDGIRPVEEFIAPEGQNGSSLPEGIADNGDTQSQKVSAQDGSSKDNEATQTVAIVHVRGD